LEFNEKLQELRKGRSLTQEELAQALFVSRTAISKWESGKGYPSIDSLKEISKFFSVTIDELLSSEELITAAKNENKSNIIKLCDLLFGMVDVISIILMVMPLYPHYDKEYITLVNLFSFRQLEQPLYCILCILYGLLFCTGLFKVIFNQIKFEKGRDIITIISVILSIITVVFLMLLKIPYAAVVAFMLLIVKTILLFKMSGVP